MKPQLQSFINNTNGHQNIGNTPENTGQCVGLVMVWVRSLGLPHVWGHAKDLLTNADPAFYEVIKNTPEAVPQAGDVIVWKKSFNGTFGHTAIATGTGSTTTFEVFEQNNPIGSPCRLHTYSSYAHVDGWLRPKVTVNTTTTVFQWTDQTKVPLGSHGEIEVQALRGILTDHLHLREENQNLKIANTELESQITVLTTDLKETRARLKKAENPAPSPVDDTQLPPGKSWTFPSFIVAFFDRLFKRWFR